MYIYIHPSIHPSIHLSIHILMYTEKLTPVICITPLNDAYTTYYYLHDTRYIPRSYDILFRQSLIRCHDHIVMTCQTYCEYRDDDYDDNDGEDEDDNKQDDDDDDDDDDHQSSFIHPPSFILPTFIMHDNGIIHHIDIYPYD